MVVALLLQRKLFLCFLIEINSDFLNRNRLRNSLGAVLTLGSCGEKLVKKAFLLLMVVTMFWKLQKLANLL